MKSIFLPFTIDKRFWNTNMPNVFLNKVYEQQIDKDADEIQYKTLLTSHYRNDQRCKLFIGKLTKCIGEILNNHHGLHKSSEFWNKMLLFWIKEFVCSIRFKIDQLNNLRKEYPKDEYSYYSYANNCWNKFDLLSLEQRHNGIFFEEIYNFISYLWLAERFYGVHVKELDITLHGEQKRQKKSVRSYMRSIRDIIWDFLQKLPLRKRVATFEAQQGDFSSIKWYLWSKGEIDRMVIHSDHSVNTEIDTEFRNRLVEKITEVMVLSDEERMILSFFPKVFPRFFVEDFKVQYEAARQYLEKHLDLSIIYTETGIVGKSAQKICMLLLQERGGKVLGQQHGGNYQVTSLATDYLHELEMTDLFYVWGPGGVHGEKNISYAPSWKLERGRNVKGKYGNYILFLETEIEAYPRSYHVGKVDEACMEYIDFEIRFFAELNSHCLSQIILRPYPHDHGWHVEKMVTHSFPMIKQDTESDFSEILYNCSLFVVDHIGTTWLEALYINKPMIMFMPRCSTVTDHAFRKYEKPYFDMLEEVGIVFYSPEAAAAQVNRIMNQGIMDWWMDEKRQETVRILQERWMMRVNDIDDWWYRELMLQAEKTIQEV